MSDVRYLGFDAGGTKTVCVAGDASAILGRGSAGSGNPRLVGVDGFRSAIVTAAREALAGLPSAPIAAAWLGVAGSEAPTLRAELRDVVRDALGAARVDISHDARLLLAAGGLEHGIGLVSGTGSSAYGRALDGSELRLGGWGYLLGDEGGGYDVAVRALRAVTAAIDGRGPKTRLVAMLAERLGIQDAADIRERFQPPPSVTEIARLAETVLAAADDDPVAGELVDAAAADLTALVEALAARLFSRPTGSDIPVVLAGGLLGPGSPLHRRVVDRLSRSAVRYRVVQPQQELAAAGLALARAGPSASLISEGTPMSDDPGQHAIEETKR